LNDEIEKNNKKEKTITIKRIRNKFEEKKIDDNLKFWIKE